MRLPPVLRPSATPRSGPHRSRLAAVLAATLLTAGLLVGAVPGSGGPAARADDRPTGASGSTSDGTLPFATYNMEGSNNGARWTGEVAPLSERHPVVALQEAGSGPPPPAYHTQREEIHIAGGGRPDGLPTSVVHTQWQYAVNREHRRVHVYFLQTDPQHNSTTGQDRWIGGRVNLAIVSHEPATDADVRVIENPLYNPTETNNAYRFNLGDSPPVDRTTRGAAAGRAAVHGCPGLNPWLPLQVMVMSCDSHSAQWRPETPEVPDGTVIWHNAAYPELCLTGTPLLDPIMALPCDGSWSQQWWDNSRAVPEKAWQPGATGVRLRASNGLYVAAENGGKKDETPLTGYSHGAIDRRDIEYAGAGDNIARIRGIDSGKCVDVLDSEHSGEGTAAVLGDRGSRNSGNDGAGRRWLVETYVDGTVRLRNEADHLCLVRPLKEQSYVTVDECRNEERQRWTVQP